MCYCIVTRISNMWLYRFCELLLGALHHDSDYSLCSYCSHSYSLSSSSLPIWIFFLISIFWYRHPFRRPRCPPPPPSPFLLLLTGLLLFSISNCNHINVFNWIIIILHREIKCIICHHSIHWSLHDFSSI